MFAPFLVVLLVGYGISFFGGRGGVPLFRMNMHNLGFFSLFVISVIGDIFFYFQHQATFFVLGHFM